MRLFIAIDFNQEKEFFQSLQKSIDTRFLKLKFTDAYHLTLKFLGEVDENKVEEIKNRLEKIEFKPFEIDLSKIGFFPNENYVKVIWMGSEYDKEAIILQKKVDDALSDMFKMEKDFKTHITLARVKFVNDKNAFKNNISSIKFEKKKVVCNSIKLVKSTLTGTGPVYEELTEFKANI